jgi:hypothetical protein
MIERYFSQTKVLIRLQSGPVGPYLPGFVSALAESRFSRDSIRRLIRGADRLCRWLDGQGVELVEANQNHIKQYVLRHARLPDIRYTQGRLPKAASSVQLIAKVLRQQGILCGSTRTRNRRGSSGSDGVNLNRSPLNVLAEPALALAINFLSAP